MPRAATLAAARAARPGLTVEETVGSSGAVDVIVAVRVAHDEGGSNHAAADDLLQEQGPEGLARTALRVAAWAVSPTG